MTLLFLVMLKTGLSCVIYDYQNATMDSHNVNINDKLTTYQPIIKSVDVFNADLIQNEFLQVLFPVQYDLDSFVAYCNK